MMTPHVRVFRCDCCDRAGTLVDPMTYRSMTCETSHHPGRPCETIACLRCIDGAIGDRDGRVALETATR